VYDEQGTLERVRDTIVFTCCGWADANEKREPETRPPLARWPHDLSIPDKSSVLDDDVAQHQNER
jgi:hypothetical protein